MKTALKVESYVMRCGQYVPFSSLTEEEKAEFRKKVKENTEAFLSTYFSGKGEIENERKYQTCN